MINKKKMNKVLTLKNSMIVTLAKVLNYGMTFTQGRLRGRFFALLTPKEQELDKNRLEICKKCSIKDDKGEPVMKNDVFTFAPDSEVYKELADLFNEDCKIDFLPSMRSDIGGIKGLIELSTVILEPMEVAQVEAILEAFGNMQPSSSELELPPLEPATV